MTHNFKRSPCNNFMYVHNFIECRLYLYLYCTTLILYLLLVAGSLLARELVVVVKR
jgi:hypothetical protein